MGALTYPLSFPLTGVDRLTFPLTSVAVLTGDLIGVPYPLLLGSSGISFNLPLADAGAGAVNLAAAGIGSITSTFTRATTAWTKLSTGLWASVASGTARSFYLSAGAPFDTTVGTYGGYLAEGQRTNNAIQSRAWTNAAWTASNVTVAQTQTGIDGVTNSAASLTASAGNGTVLQSITLGSQANVFQPFVKRLTGTGEIDITLDNGGTWTNITASINSSTFTQVQATKTAANPIIGFRIVTNGDAIAVDMGDMQGGTFASTPIPTTTVAVTRNADVLTYPAAGNVLAAQGGIYAEFTTYATTGNLITATVDSTTLVGLLISGTGNLIVGNAGGSGGNIGSPPFGSIKKGLGTWTGTTGSVYSGGIQIGSRGATGAALTPGTNVGIGTASSGTVQLFGTLANVRFYSVEPSAGQGKTMTT